LALASTLLLVRGVKPILLSVLLASIAACATDDAPVGYGAGLGTPESPVPSQGSYAVTSRIDLTLATSQIGGALANLRAFSGHPAQLLLQLAASIESPALQQLDAALPSAVRDRLEGWLDTEIDKAKIGGTTLRQFTGGIADVSASIFDQVTIESTLTITPTGAAHGLTDLNFRPLYRDIIVPIGGLDADALTQRTTAVVGEGGALALGDQRFGLAFGAHAWQGINLASTTLFGADPSGLATALDCAAIAQVVATKCVSGACVGHASQLQAVCESSRAGLVGDLRDQVTRLDLVALHVAHGAARLVDDDGDGVADRIVDGTWDLQVDHGLGPSHITATFIGD
jgi:hypothetical protein